MVSPVLDVLNLAHLLVTQVEMLSKPGGLKDL